MADSLQVFNLAAVYAEKEEWEKVVDCCQQVYDIESKVFGQDHTQVKETRQVSRYEEALVQYQKAHEVTRGAPSRVRPGAPLVATSKYNIAGLKEAQGELEEARSLFLECEQICAKR